MQFLGGDRRKTQGEIKAHLIAEYRARARAGAIGLRHTVILNTTHELEIGLHESGDQARRAANAIRTQRPGIARVADTPVP